MPYNESQKQAIYKWRAQHRDKVREINNRSSQKYYEKVRDSLADKYKFKTECRRLGAMLAPDTTQP